MLVQKLDRVFDTNDMAGAVGVAVIEHGCQRGRLAGAGGAYHQNQAAILECELFQLDRQAQFGKGGDLMADMAHDHTHFAALVVHVDAEAATIGQPDRQVHLLLALKLLDLLFAHNLPGEFFYRAGGQGLIAEGKEVALAL